MSTTETPPEKTLVDVKNEYREQLQNLRDAYFRAIEHKEADKLPHIEELILKMMRKIDQLQICPLLQSHCLTTDCMWYLRLAGTMNSIPVYDCAIHKMAYKI